LLLPLRKEKWETNGSVVDFSGRVEVFGAEKMRRGNGVVLSKDGENLITFRRPKKNGLLIGERSEIRELGEVGTTKKVVVEREGVRTIIGCERSISDDEGDGSTVRTKDSVLGLVEGERSSGKNGRKETGGGNGNKFFFDRDVFFPGMEAGLDDFDLIGLRIKIQSIVGGSGETTIDENLSLFGMGRSG